MGCVEFLEDVSQKSHNFPIVSTKSKSATIENIVINIIFCYYLRGQKRLRLNTGELSESVRINNIENYIGTVRK